MSMSRILAWIIFTIAHAITFPFGSRRQSRALYRTSIMLLPSADFFSTPNWGGGELQFRPEGARQFMNPEPDTIEWIDDFPHGPVTLWDVGANVGVYVLYAALRSNVHVLAFEPGASSYQVLNDNIKANDMDRRVSAYPVALGANSKIDVLNMDSTAAGGSMHGFGVEVDQFGDLIDVQFHQGTVGFTIDDFVRLFSPPLPTHLKIDVDGLEPDILRGGQGTLSSPTVRSVCLEVEGDDARCRELMNLMAELGFVPRPKRSPSYRNIIFDKLDAHSP